MNNYKLKKDLPDALKGTMLSWDKEEKKFFYLKNYPKQSNTKVYLNKEDVTTNHKWFSKVVEKKEKPLDSKYYKGYRYKKTELSECWYDENNIKRKLIKYDYRGKKYDEHYYNEKGELHNEDGYARQEWNENGEIEYSYYYLYGEFLDTRQWKGYRNPKSPDYYKGFRTIKYGGDIQWIDNEGFVRRNLIVYGNKIKRSDTYYNEDGLLHNEDGPAIKRWDTKGKLISEEYYLNGVHLTEQQWKLQTGRVKPSDTIQPLVYEYPTKYKEGFILKEKEELLEKVKTLYPNFNMEKYYDALSCNTCMLIDGDIITYHCDIELALRCGIENRNQTMGEWD